MKRKRYKFCRKPGCTTLTIDSYCEKHHKADRRRDLERGRVSSAKRGYGRPWRKARADYLIEHSLCEGSVKTGVPDGCKDNERVTAAVLVDHIEPHRGDMKKFWDESNWQALCRSCHDIKTARGQ